VTTRWPAAKAAAAWIAVAALAAAAQAAAARTVQLTAGIHVITAEVADNEPARLQGLMHREGLAPNHGMLFVFERRATQCMWMRNTLIPLAVAFIDDDGTIANVEEMEPRTDASHCAKHPVRYALEMSGGWFKAHGIGAGSRINQLAQP